jgi:regulator of nucleoside diphosphate kinase
MTMGRDPAMLTTRDGYVLEKMLRDWPPLTQEWLALLKRKLASGCLPAQGRIPADLAMIDARVSFRCASGLTDTRTLCLPGTYAPGSAFLPITTFYGLALLGLREGQAMTFDRPEGRRDWIVLEKVLFQPATAGLASRAPAEATRSPFRVIAGGFAGRAFTAANENGPGQGPGPSAA